MSSSDLNDVAVVTVTFNSERVVSALAAQAKSFSRVVVVDNASKDHTVLMLRQSVPDAVILQQTQNLGFGSANNIGFQHALHSGARYVLFLNPDCQISAEHVQLLKDVLVARSDAALASPRMTNDAGEYRSVSRWDFLQPYQNKYVREVKVSPDCADVVDEVCIDGACFLVNAEYFQRIGAFTADIFLFYEEDDVNLRAARAGFSSVLVPRAVARHSGGGSTSSNWRINLLKAYSVRWSRLFLTERYVGAAWRFAEAVRITLAAPIAITFFCLFFNRKKLLRWLGWGMAGLDGLMLTKCFRRWL